VKALALVESSDHVCGRYRISAYASTLAASGWSISVEGIATAPLSRVRQIRRAAHFDCVILQRKLLPGWQLSILRRNSRRLLFDFDDAVLYRDSYDPRGPMCRRRGSRFSRTVRAADLILAGNDFLAQSAREQGAVPDHVRVMPTCIETHNYRPKNEFDAIPQSIRLVWIGSSSTLQGLEQQRPLMERLGREISGLTLRVICDRFPKFDCLAVEPVTWNGSTEAEDLASGDIGISWLPNDLWSRGKCGLKVLQFFAAGLPVVANPVGVHPEMIKPGLNGFLPRTDDEWVEAIRQLAVDSNLRRQMGRQARATVERNYSIDSWAPRFVAALEGRSDVLSPNIRPTGQAVRP
jgi:glycosyltransferase involved in cell wall biosynthesis